MPDYTDERQQYAHAALYKTGFGPEKGSRLGANEQLMGTMAGYIFVEADAGLTTEQHLGMMPIGGTIEEVVNLDALAALTVADVDLPAYNGEGAISLVSGGDLSAVGELLAAPVYTPLAINRPISVTVSAGTPGEVVKLRIKVIPSEHMWK